MVEEDRQNQHSLLSDSGPLLLPHPTNTVASNIFSPAQHRTSAR